jgi:hypothetical protein
MLIAALSHIENENEMTEHTDALKICAPLGARAYP